MTGVSQYVGQFASPGDPEYAPPVTRGETKAEKKARIAVARKAAHDDVLAHAVAAWDPQATVGATEDPYKTLFVAKINYDTPEVRQHASFHFDHQARCSEMLRATATEATFIQTSDSHLWFGVLGRVLGIHVKGRRRAKAQQAPPRGWCGFGVCVEVGRVGGMWEYSEAAGPSQLL